jgi:hypothetical protein
MPKPSEQAAFGIYPQAGKRGQRKPTAREQLAQIFSDDRAMEMPQFGEIDLDVPSAANRAMSQRMVERQVDLKRQADEAMSPLEKIAGGMQTGRLIGSGMYQAAKSLPTAITKGGKAAEDYIAENIYKPNQPKAYEYAEDVGNFLSSLETDYKIPPIIPQAMMLQNVIGPATRQAGRAAQRGARQGALNLAAPRTLNPQAGSVRVKSPGALQEASGIARGGNPIQGAVVLIGDRMFMGRTHGDALNRAVYEGAVRKEGGKYIFPKGAEVNSDLFMTNTGQIIDRYQALKMADIGASETAIEKGLMQNNPARSMSVDSYMEKARALKQQRDKLQAPQDEAMRLAQQRAALPVERGGLGLPANNTPEQRAAAMGFDRDTYHGSLRDIKKLDPRLGSTESHAGRGIYSTDSPEDASLNYASIYGPDVSGRVERGLEERDKDFRKIYGRMRDEVLTPRQQEIILRNAAGADNLGVVYPLKVRADKSIHLDAPEANPVRIGPFEQYDEAAGAYIDTPHTEKFREALDEFGELGGEANPIYEVVQDGDGPVPARDVFNAVKKTGNETGLYDPYTGDIVSGGVAAGDFVKHFGVDEIRHTPEFRNQQLNIGNEHTISLNPDNVRSRFAAFDPFRKDVATAAAMGVLAPDLLAKEKDKDKKKDKETKKAEGGRVHFSDNPDVMQLELAGGGLVKGLKAAAKAAKTAAKPVKGTQDVLPAAEREENLQKFLGNSRIRERLYHATPKDFKQFKPGGDDPTMSGPAIWLTPDATKQPAFHNIGSRSQEFREGTNVMPVHVQARSPLMLDDKLSIEWARDVFADGSREFPDLISPKTIEELKKEGYDSIIHADPYGNRGGEQEIIMFEPNKIKSAIGNRGTYDIEDPDITKAAGGAVQMSGGGALAKVAKAAKAAKAEKTQVPIKFPVARGPSVDEIRAMAERMAPQVTGEFVRAAPTKSKPNPSENVVGKSRQQFDREKNLQIGYQNIKPPVTPSEFDYAKHKDELLIGASGDVTPGNRMLVSIDNQPLSEPVHLQAGPEWGLYNPSAWAATDEMAKTWMKRADKAAEEYNAKPHLHYHKMTPDANWYAMHHLHSLLGHMRPEELMIKNPELYAKMVDEIRTKDVGFGKHPEFVGFEDPLILSIHTQVDPNLRRHLGKILGQPTFSERYGLRSGQDVMAATSLPDLRDLEVGSSGYAVVPLDTKAPLQHFAADSQTYDTGFPMAGPVERSKYPIPYQLVYRDTLDWMKKNPSEGKSSEFGRMSMIVPKQQIDDELIDAIGEYQLRMKALTGKKKGGAVRKYAAGGDITADDLILEERKL